MYIQCIYIYIFDSRVRPTWCLSKGGAIYNTILYV